MINFVDDFFEKLPNKILIFDFEPEKYFSHNLKTLKSPQKSPVKFSFDNF
jgi:hypothetical protein